MDYARKWWVRLYIDESNEDRAKPLFCRSLRDYLLRYAEPLGPKGEPTARTGELMRGKTPEHAVELLLNAMGAQLDERDQVAEYLEHWLDDGWLTMRRVPKKGGHILCITNYVAAQTARSKAAIRQQRYRARKKNSQGNRPTKTVTRNATPHATGNGTGDATDTRQFGDRGVRIRERERIRERGSNIRGPSVTDNVTSDALGEQVCDLAVRYLDNPVTVGTEHGEPHTWPPIREVIAAGNEVWGRKHQPVNSGDRVVQVILERLTEGITPSELVEAVRGSKHDDWVQKNFKLQSVANLLKHPDKIEEFRLLYANPPDAPAAEQQPAGEYETGWEDKGSDVVKAPGDVEAKAAAP